VQEELGPALVTGNQGGECLRRLFVHASRLWRVPGLAPMEVLNFHPS
jgi:hypothetical protein